MTDVAPIQGLEYQYDDEGMRVFRYTDPMGDMLHIGVLPTGIMLTTDEMNWPVIPAELVAWMATHAK